ncbi:uncharacterized protein LOC144437561 [Glandiceps talaboti]
MIDSVILNNSNTSSVRITPPSDDRMEDVIDDDRQVDVERNCDSETEERVALGVEEVDEHGAEVTTPGEGKTTASSSTATGKQTYHRHPKPPLSYIALIAMAIRDSPSKKLTLAEINDYLMKKYPFFRGSYTGWRNSVRHNLSLNECFTKVLRDPSRPWGKDNYWTINENSEYTFADGVFRRRRKRINRKKSRVGSGSKRDDDVVSIEDGKVGKFNSSFSIENIMTSKPNDASSFLHSPPVFVTAKPQWPYGVPILPGPQRPVFHQHDIERIKFPGYAVTNVGLNPLVNMVAPANAAAHHHNFFHPYYQGFLPTTYPYPALQALQLHARTKTQMPQPAHVGHRDVIRTTMVTTSAPVHQNMLPEDLTVNRQARGNGTRPSNGSLVHRHTSNSFNVENLIS